MKAKTLKFYKKKILHSYNWLYSLLGKGHINKFNEIITQSAPKNDKQGLLNTNN